MTSNSSIARRTVAGVILVLALFAPIGILAHEQAPAQDPSKPERLAPMPVRVDMLLMRFQGEKKVSSLPFSLLATAANSNESRPVSMRMGIDVPVGTATTTDTSAKPATSGGTVTSSGTTTTRVQYRNVGTDVDCLVTRVDETRFSVRVSVSDSSIYSPDGDSGKTLKNVEAAAFRTFSTNNTVVLKDGQAVLFATGTDKISGETLKMEVTLHLVR
jgi:hypothetical protein